MESYYYVYETENLTNGKKYIGQHGTIEQINQPKPEPEPPEPEPPEPEHINDYEKELQMYSKLTPRDKEVREEKYLLRQILNVLLMINEKIK